jgi:hypothetical protein
MSIESRRPRVNVADGFEMPKFPGDDAAVIEDVFDLTNYTSAPLIRSGKRREVFGHDTPPGVVGPFETNGFIIHTAVPLEVGIGVEALVAPPPDMATRQFLELSLSLLGPAMPDRKDFPLPINRITASMARVGLRAVVGFNMCVDGRDPSIGFGALFVPRLYMSGEFKGPNDPEPRHEFAIKMAAAVFAFLTLEELKTTNDASDTQDRPKTG